MGWLEQIAAVLLLQVKTSLLQTRTFRLRTY